MGIRQHGVQSGSPLLFGTYGDNHQPFLIPGWAHATTGLSTQVINLAAGTGALNIAGSIGTQAMNVGGTIYLPFPMPISIFLSGATDNIIIVIVGLDSTGQSATETLNHPASGTVVSGKVLWSRIDSATVTSNALGAITCTLGMGYRAAVNTTGIVPLPLPFIPQKYTNTSGLTATYDLLRMWPLLSGGGAFVASSIVATPATGVPSVAGQMFMPSALTYSTQATTTGVSTFTNTGGTYGSGIVVVTVPNVAVPANVTTSPIWALSCNAEALLNGR